MNDREPATPKHVREDLHPRTESAARMSSKSSITGALIAVMLVVLLLVWGSSQNVALTIGVGIVFAALIILRVMSVSKRTHDTSPFADAVRDALAQDNRVNERLIIVRVENGVAHLSGRQENIMARDAAAEIALSVPGIEDVSNEIVSLPSI